MAEYDKAIPPGREGSIRVKIYGSKIHPGRFDKTWAVTTNDPENERLMLHVKGTVKKVFDESGQLYLSGFRDDEIKGDIVLKNLLDHPLNITGWRWSEKALESGIDRKIGAELDTLEAGKEYRLSVWKKPNTQPEMYRGEIILTIDDSLVKEKKISVRLTISQDVELHPNKVYFGEMVVSDGKTKSFDRQFRIIAARGDSLQILGAIPDREEITVNIQEVQAGKVYKGTVRVRPPSKMGTFEGNIKISTNYSDYEEITLYVAGRVRTDLRPQKAMVPAKK